MSKKESIIRYQHIINKLRRNPSSFDEILDYLEMQSEIQGLNLMISTRTFQRDCNDIREIYGIDIQYNASIRAYSIEEEYQMEAQERALESFDLFNALNVKEQLSEYIHFEKRKPLGTENIYILLQAIKDKNIVHFNYQKFGSEEPSARKVEPFALKEDKFRWYLVGNDLAAKDIRIFGLDRMTKLTVTREEFNRPKFDVQQFFKNFFGVDRYQGNKLEIVELSFTPFQGNYIKTLPLHETQKILVDDENEVRIQLELYVTIDFIMELLSFAEQVKVIKPKSLAKEIKNKHKSAIEQY